MPGPWPPIGSSPAPWCAYGILGHDLASYEDRLKNPQALAASSLPGGYHQSRNFRDALSNWLALDPATRAFEAELGTEAPGARGPVLDCDAAGREAGTAEAAAVAAGMTRVASFRRVITLQLWDPARRLLHLALKKVELEKMGRGVTPSLGNSSIPPGADGGMFN